MPINIDTIRIEGESPEILTRLRLAVNKGTGPLPGIFLLIFCFLGATLAHASPEMDPTRARSGDEGSGLKQPGASAKKNYSFTEAMGKSIWGDVYAHPEDWQELS